MAWSSIAKGPHLAGLLSLFLLHKLLSFRSKLFENCRRAQIDFAWICPLIRFLHFLPDVRIALPEPRVLRVRRVADYPLSFFDLHVDSFPAQTIPSALIASAHPVKLIGATPTQATALRMIRLTLQVGKVTVTYTVGAARYITQSLETPVPTPPPPAAPIFLYTAGPPFYSQVLI